jgi:phosphate transport system substrate-binding protein
MTSPAGSTLPTGWIRAGLALMVMALVMTLIGGAAGAATLSTASGQGSTYAAEAFQQWTQSAQTNGLSVNYTATSSPAGLQSYNNGTANFAGTEAEFSSLGLATSVPRGYAYTPDVAGATAIMYNVSLNADGSNPVNYLHLSRLTVAKIFMGMITNWDDPAISADNKGLVLPNEHIRLVFRGGPSGTTALFYDFVQKTDPTDFATFAAQNGFSTANRLLEIDTGIGFQGQYAIPLQGSDQQAQYISGPSGLWTIGYDEFAYSKVYDDNVAWIQNASGNWVQPYADNISAALQSAVLAPDTSQNLNGVYTSTNPQAYPISAYSYLLYQCAPTAARPTCVTPYADPGIANTMAGFMSYVACAGQVQMASIGYAPLPTQLSQFMANAVSYMTGQPAVQLTAQNCTNPQFNGGSLGTGAAPPPDPTAAVVSLGNGAGGHAGSTAASGSTATTTAGATPSSSGGPAAAVDSQTTTTSAGAAAVGKSGSANLAVGGGSTDWRTPAPVAFVVPAAKGLPLWPLIALFFMLLIPVLLFTLADRRSSRRRGDPGNSSV